MAEHAELETLSSRELHDRAVKRALHHVDLRFLWTLLKEIPNAEALAGPPGESEADIVSVAALLNDYVHAGEGAVGDTLRPLYLDYLAAHGG